MYAGKLIFAQLTDLIHPEQFHRCVRRYHGDYKVKTFSCWNQFLCMAFGQLTFRESLRDVETCLRSRHDQLYHLGIRGEISRSVLADANRQRDRRIYHDLASSEEQLLALWKPVCAHVTINFITWEFAARFPVASWPTPTASATGAFTMIWPGCSSVAPAPSTPTRRITR